MPVYAKPKTAARLYCPVNFEPQDVLPRRQWEHADGLVYLCHTLIMRSVFNPQYKNEKHDGYIPLLGRHMRNILGTRKWPKIKRIAINCGLVECNDSYRAGKFSMGYRLCEPYRNVRWVRRTIEDERLVKRLRKWRASDRQKVWKEIQAGNCPVALEVCEHLYRHLRRIRIDERIDEQLTNVTEIAVEMIRRAEWRLDVDDYGRVHTNITNLKRSLRRFLSVDGRRLVNLDIANSQPLFVGVHFFSQSERGRGQEEREEREGQGSKGQGGGARGERHVHICGALFGSLGKVPSDLRRFVDLCERGGLYSFIRSELEVPIEYGELKRRVLATIYDKDSHRNSVYRVLDDNFPTLMQCIRLVKRQDYRHLAHLAQRTESEFIMGRCVKRLSIEHPNLFITTIHDSIMTTEGDEEVVRGVMLAEFEKLNIHATVRIER